jgi:hypothetical protein
MTLPTQFLSSWLSRSAGEAVASTALFAQTNATQDESFLSWIVRSAGLFSLLTILVGVAVFVAMSIVVATARRRDDITAHHVFLLLPLAAGVIHAVGAAIASLRVFELQVMPFNALSAVAFVLSAVIEPLSEAIIVTVPSLLVFLIGRAVRFPRGGADKQD